jgi:hypothetical protein
MLSGTWAGDLDDNHRGEHPNRSEDLMFIIIMWNEVNGLEWLRLSQKLHTAGVIRRPSCIYHNNIQGWMGGWLAFGFNIYACLATGCVILHGKALLKAGLSPWHMRLSIWVERQRLGVTGRIYDGNWAGDT